MDLEGDDPECDRRVAVVGLNEFIKNSNILKRKWINRVVFLKYFINIYKGDFLFFTGMKIKSLLHI